MWQHWHEEEDKDVDDDGPVYVMNQKTAIGHGIARVSGCLSQNIRVRGLPSGLPLHLRLLHQVLSFYFPDINFMVRVMGGSGGGKTNCFWSATVALSFLYISSLGSQKDLYI